MYLLLHIIQCVFKIWERIEMFVAGIEPVHTEKLWYLVECSNDWAILSCFIFFSILKDLRTMQKYGGKIYQWCLKQRKWKHGLWNISFHNFILKMISDGYLGRPCSDFLSKCIKHLNLDEKIFSAAQVCTNGTRAIFNTIALTKHNRKNGQFRCFDR